MLRISLYTLCAYALLTSIASAERFTVEVEVGGQRYEGTPLAWSKSEVVLLSRDGFLRNFPASQAKDFRKTAASFSSYRPAKMRNELAREFGRAFDVSMMPHYIVVHPDGQRDQWARRFEELYRAYLRYFNSRGMRPDKPEFPLVAVVFPHKREFIRYAQQTGEKILPNTLGYYSPRTNRILLYDVTNGNPDDPNWHINADTIIHEATHQLAFNTGLHNRYAKSPRWVVEGLATMFEAKGVWNLFRYSGKANRINRSRLISFKDYMKRRPKGSLAQFISSDRMFEADPDDGYAEAWALTFFLAETRPSQYARFLRSIAARKDFTAYPSPERLADFTTIFGKNLPVLESHYLRHLKRLEVPPRN